VGVVTNQQSSTSDAFTQMWLDMMSQFGTGLAGAGAPAGEAFGRQLRKSFFDAWARYWEEFLGSEAFLESMKKGMESSLAMKEQMDRVVRQAMEGSPLASASESEAMIQALRRIEESLHGQLRSLTDRVAALEEQVAGKSPSRAVRGRGTKGGSA